LCVPAAADQTDAEQTDAEAWEWARAVVFSRRMTRPHTKRGRCMCTVTTSLSCCKSKTRCEVSLNWRLMGKEARTQWRKGEQRQEAQEVGFVKGVAGL
jgi:hypothetical protein